MDTKADLISECNNSLPNAKSNKEKLELINTIIQIKISDVGKYYSEIYRDFKRLSIYYIDAVDERKYEYDYINHEYLLSTINIFKTKEKIALLNYVIRKLKKNGLEEEIAKFQYEKNKAEIKDLKENFPKKFINLIFRVVSLNFFTISLTIVISFILLFVVLLPTTNDIQFFEINYENFSTLFYLNHFLNCLMFMCGLASENFIKPINTQGVITLIFGKLLFIAIILNICITKITEFLKSKF